MSLASIYQIIESDMAHALELNKALSALPLPLSAKQLAAQWIDSPLGAILAIADDKALCMLEFHDRKNLADEVKRTFAKDVSRISYGTSSVLTLLAQELKLYFSRKLTIFTTPVSLQGTPFQMAAWSSLKNIPYGETRSYREQAQAIGHPLAHRAVANANSRNKIAIIIPCHRVKRHYNSLGGYGAGVDRKAWLLNLERQR